jgi:hypothetical protein
VKGWVQEEVISKIPCGCEEEWKAFNSATSSKNVYFQICSQKGAEHQKISYNAPKTLSIDI